MPAKIKIPSNLVPEVMLAAERTGVPFPVLAAVIQAQNPAWNLSTAQIGQVGNKLASAGSFPGEGGQDWASAAGYVFGGGNSNYAKRINDLLQIDTGGPDKTGYGPVGTDDEERWDFTDPVTPLRNGANLGAGLVPIQTSGGAPTTGDNSMADLSDIYALFKQYVGRPPQSDAEAIGYGRLGLTVGQIRQELQGQPEAKQYRESLSKQNAVPWADNIFQQNLGRHATSEELDAVIRNGWTPDQTQAYLRSQPYGANPTVAIVNGTPRVVTVGDAANLKDAMTRSYQKTLGRDPTPGELNFAVVNGIPTNHTDALAEQTRDKVVWAGNPDLYTLTRANIQRQLAGYGIQVPLSSIDPNLVNQAVNGKWTDDQIKASIGAGQAPGAPQGVSLDTQAQTRKTVEGIWNSYFPGTRFDPASANKYIGQTPDMIAKQIGALPSPDAEKLGLGYVPQSAYLTAKNAATQSLAKLGVLDREPSPTEIAHFAQQGADAESVNKFYSTDAGVLAKNPGAQYGKSREGYRQDRADIEGAYSKQFGATPTNAATQASKNDTTPGAAAAEPDWLKEVFQEGYDPKQSQAIFDDYYKRLGTAPTAQDIDQFKMRSTERFNDDAEIRKSNSAVYGTDQGGNASTLAKPRTFAR